MADHWYGIVHARCTQISSHCMYNTLLSCPLFESWSCRQVSRCSFLMSLQSWWWLMHMCLVSSSALPTYLHTYLPKHSKIYFLASYIAERTLQEVDILCYLPSMVAAAAVYLARKNCGLRPWVSRHVCLVPLSWKSTFLHTWCMSCVILQSPSLVYYTKYTEEALLPCLRVITPWLNSRSQTLQVCPLCLLQHIAYILLPMSLLTHSPSCSLLLPTLGHP